MKHRLPAARGTVALLLATAAAVFIFLVPVSALARYQQPAMLAVAGVLLFFSGYQLHRARIEREHQQLRETGDLLLDTVTALARAIDAKDRGAQAHLGRLEFHASRLAQALGLQASEVQAVKTAALLHNIGKLAVPVHILTKSGPLTEEEFQTVQIHPQIGAEIIASVPFPYAVAPLILAQRERWDGKGYPRGLEGEQIPIGARILTVVDYYDALTTDRPYRKAVSHEHAINRLMQESGRALDPGVVQAFLHLLPDLAKEFEAPGASVPDSTMHHAFNSIAMADREVGALYDIAQSLGTRLGLADTMAVVSDKLMKIVPWSGCALFVQQGNGDGLRCRFAAGVDAPLLVDTFLHAGNQLVEWAAGDRRTLVNADPRISYQDGVGDGSALHSAIVCPLFYEDVFIGCLALYHVEPNHYNEDHRRLVEHVAEQAGAVIHNAVLFEQAQEDSMTDPLTALPNRRSLLLHLTRELARAERLRNALSVVVIDLDGFKSINDACGHDAGDQALREVAIALRGTLRPYDLCVRYGGDEFVVVLGECSREMADVKLRELRVRISEIGIDAPSGERLQLRASAGAAVFPQDGATHEALVAEADRQMYRDKASRRGPAALSGSGPAEPFDVTSPARG